jgi:hypothetical protein
MKLLRLREPLQGVQIEEIWPGDNQERESIWFHEGYTVEHPAGMKAGTIAVNEDATQHVIVDVVYDAKPFSEVKARCKVLVGEVLATLAEHKRITVDSRSLSMRSKGFKYVPYKSPLGNGLACNLSVGISGQRRP